MKTMNADLSQAIAYADSLQPLFSAIMKQPTTFGMLPESRREDGLQDAMDILAEQKRTRGDED